MSVKLRKINAQIRDPDKNNQLVPFGLLGSDAVETIESAKTQAISEMETKRATSLASIPNDYTTLAQDVTDLKGDLSDIQDEIDSFEGISYEAKEAFLALFENVAFIGDNGRTLYNNLYHAFYETYPISWDIEWTTEDGSPINNGFDKTSSGIYGTMTSAGYNMNNTSETHASCTLVHVPDITYESGIYEVEAYIEELSSGIDSNYNILMPGHRLFVYDNKLWFNANAINQREDDINIKNIEYGKIYTIRGEYDKDGYAKIYCNGNLIYEYNNSLLASASRFITQTSGNSKVTLKAIRFKEGVE